MEIERQVWKKFIQINVYGRTLRQLNKNGLDLNYLLNEIGCKKFWISEGFAYNGDSDSETDEDPGPDDSLVDDTMPLFSNTIANTKYPRCSTPVASKLYSKMTLCPSKVVSRISANSDSGDDDIQEIDRFHAVNLKDSLRLNNNDIINDGSDELVIQRLVDDLVDEIVVNEVPNVFDKEIKEEQVTGITEECLAANFEENRRLDFEESGENDDVEAAPPSPQPPNITSDDVRDEEMRMPAEPSQHEITVVENETIASRIGSFIMKMEKKSIYNNLKRAASEVKRGRKKAIKVKKSNTVYPLRTPESANVVVKAPVKAPRLSSRKMNKTVSSEKVYCDLTPVSMEVEENRNLDREWFGMPDPVDPVEGNRYLRNEAPQDVEFEDNYGEFSTEGDWADANDSFNTCEDGDKTMTIPPSFEVDPHDPHREVEVDDDMLDPARPILARNRNSKSRGPKTPKNTKKVSFAMDGIADIQAMTDVEYKKFINLSRSIKCQFPACKKVYKWKIKYGKMRLIDHALSHSKRKDISCQYCDKTTGTVRQMRYHNLKEHANKKTTGYGMKHLSVDENDVKEMWRICYKNHIPIIGDVTTKANHIRLRRKSDGNPAELKRSSQRKKAVVEKVDSDDDDTEKDEVDVTGERGDVNLDDF